MDPESCQCSADVAVQERAMCICNSTPLGIPEILDVFGYKAPEQQGSLWCNFTCIGTFSSLEKNMTCWEAGGRV